MVPVDLQPIVLIQARFLAGCHSLPGRIQALQLRRDWLSLRLLALMARNKLLATC